MPGKARVHELAQEFGVDSRTILAMLKQQGEFVKSASSTVEAGVARRLREQLQQGRRAPAPVQPRLRPAPARPNVEQDALDDAARLFGRERGSLRPAREQHPTKWPDRPTPISPWQRKLIPPEDEKAWTSRGVSDPAQALILMEWGLTPRVLDIHVDGQTVARWLRGGESPGQMVARLRAHGLDAEAG